MLVADAGEFGLISKLAALIDRKNDKGAQSWKALSIGIGDDAAAWKPGRGHALITTDILVEGVHFDLSYTGWKDLGWKSIAINVSDIYAMGGKPQYALVSLALPGSHTVDNVLAMYNGMIEACNAYGVAIAGGNVSASAEVTVTIAMTGTAAPGSNLMTRSAARPGDLIAVCGHPGLSAAGLSLLKTGRKLSTRAYTLFSRAHLLPAPPLDSGPALAACGIKAAIDISDGLVADLGHICESSGVGAVVYTASLPIHPLLKRHFAQDCVHLALAGGEDYILLFTGRRADVTAALDSSALEATVIGEITKADKRVVTVLDTDGRPVRLKQDGWDHYRGPRRHA